MINKERLLASFLDYVRIDSESCHEGVIARRLARELEELGFEVSVDDTMAQTGSEVGNVLGTLPGTTQGEPILLCAHMDTVVPGNGVKPVVKDGVVYSSGDTVLGADDKSGIAAIMEAVRCMLEQGLPHPTIQVLFTVCEEIGLYGSCYLDYSKLVAKRAMVMDSGTPGGIMVCGPGQYVIRANVIGRKAHAGAVPERGISAIQVLCEAISNMKQLRIDPETTANVGTIHAQYPHNVVAERAMMEAECRSRNGDKLEAQVKHMEDCLKLACEKYGAQLELERIRSYDPYAHDENDPFILEVSEAMRSVGITPKLGKSGGGSDVNNMVQHGITALMVGTGMQMAHTTEESIPVDDLNGTAEMLLALIGR